MGPASRRRRDCKATPAGRRNVGNVDQRRRRRGPDNGAGADPISPPATASPATMAERPCFDMAMRMISPPSLAANAPYAVAASDSLRKWKIRKGKLGLTRDIPRMNSKTTLKAVTSGHSRIWRRWNNETARLRRDGTQPRTIVAWGLSRPSSAASRLPSAPRLAAWLALQPPPGAAERRDNSRRTVADFPRASARED